MTVVVDHAFSDLMAVALGACLKVVGDPAAEPDLISSSSMPS